MDVEFVRGRPSSGSRKMNRVKAGDAWARVSTKRYGSRLDGNEARIETPSLPSFLLSFLRLSCARSFLPQGIYPRYTARSTGYITYRVGTPLVSFDYPRIMRETSRERGLIKSFRFRGKDYRRDFFRREKERGRIRDLNRESFEIDDFSLFFFLW